MLKRKMPMALIPHALAAIFLIASGAAHAQTSAAAYPTRPVKLVVGFAKSASAIDKLRGLGLDAASVCGNTFASRVAREVTTYSQMAKALDLKAD